MKAKIYWHTLSNKKQREVLGSQMPVQTFLKKYTQPTWCGYHEALRGMLGCWTLIYCGKLTKKMCGKCEMRKAKVKL